MTLFASIWVRIPLGPDNFKTVGKYNTFQNSFYGGFDSLANTVFSFETNFG